jgi:hypothetical protein
MRGGSGKALVYRQIASLAKKSQCLKEEQDHGSYTTVIACAGKKVV